MIDKDDILKCKICGIKFSDHKHLHDHLKKVHKQKIKDYWQDNFPRHNLVTGKKISYSSFDSYFDSLFDTRDQMIFWLRHSDKDIRKNVLLELLNNRIKRKGFNFLPCEVENMTTKIPNIKFFVESFDGYDTFSLPQIGLNPRFRIRHFPSQEHKEESPLILIDTREQKPLSFKNSKSQKLAIGDYCLGNGKSDGTFIDRKSGSDFRSTMTQGFDRFLREIERVETLDSFLFVVVEDSIQNLKRNDKYQKWEQGSLEYAFRNMRSILENYHNRVQFLFTGCRKRSEFLYPFILQEGKNIWDLDLQYHLSKRGFIE